MNSTGTNIKTKKKTKSEEYLDAVGNEGLKAFVQGNSKNGVTATGGANYNPIPEDATNEDRAVMEIWQNAYNNSADIEKNALQAKFNANKAHDLASKYLAVQNQANGLGGLGIADTSSLRLSSQYQQALSDANSARTSALNENRMQMNENINTVRGEWDSQEEAKVQTKYANVESNILSIDDKTKVEAYLDAMGYTEGTQERSDLMATWELAFGEGDGTNSSTSTNSFGIPDNIVENYNINATDGKSFDPENTDAQGVLNRMSQVSYGKEQSDYINHILAVSKNWTAENNGTYVDFNYGATGGRGTAGTVFVFYNGKWYLTTESRKTANAKFGNAGKYYEQGSGSGDFFFYDKYPKK